MRGYGVTSSRLGWRSIQAQNPLVCSWYALVQDTTLIHLSQQCFPDGSRSAAAGMRGYGVTSSGLGWRSIQGQNLLVCS